MTTSSSQSTPPSHNQGSQFATVIGKARQQWSHRGIFEITENHRLYELSRCIQMGIRECVDPHLDNQGDVHLQDEDYQEELIKTHFENDIRKHFEFRSYAPKVFASIRALLGIKESEYLESISPSGSPLPCLEFITSSKSGMTFFMCNNKAFLMKTEPYSNICFLKEHFLRRLVGHFDNYPHSLLVKIIGCYFIKLRGNKGIYFTVMQSVFYPDDRITERYDLKGCSANRYVKPLNGDSTDVIVFKDNNFEGKTIKIGAQKAWFTRQVEIDTRFLEDQGVMDYSLILGVQLLHADEKTDTGKLADVVIRARRSVRASPWSPGRICPDCKGRRRSTVATRQTLNEPPTTFQPQDSDQIDSIVQEILDNTTDDNQFARGANVTNLNSNNIAQKKELHEKPFGGNSQASEIGQDLPGMLPVSGHNGNQQKDTQGTSEENPERTPKKPESMSLNVSHFGTDLNSVVCQCAKRFQLDECKDRNQRLLPNTANPLHVIDGENHRYFIGIIDVFTQFNLKKKMEYLYKCLRYPTQSFSTIGPQQYAQRFRELCTAKCE